MELALIDWALIGIYLAISLLIALRFSGRAGQSLGEFFLGGRSLPWYVAGVSMVATTFAADTPLAVTELVARDGVSGNWLWWNALIGGMLTAFFFARLWRRANILTEVEFIALRYSGPQARFLRGFKAVYLGLIMNVMIIGWVNLALISLFQSFFGLTMGEAVGYTAIAMLIVAAYSSLGGLLGVAITDMVQFLIAMTGSIVLAVLVLNSEEIGGMSGLQEKLADQQSVFSFFPEIDWGDGGSVAGTLSLGLGSFLAFVGFQWWASWYPGSEPGGGGYVAQRMMSAKSEKDSIFATLFFQIAHYALRPWPWIIVGLCTLVLYPELGEAGTERLGYVNAMRDFLPDGLRGLLLVAFLAAYMSTISTQLNWGASYLVNDLYVPFMRPEKSFASKEIARKNYVLAGRIATLLLMGIGLGVTTQLTSIAGVWEFIFQCGAGLGAVLIMRWFWWRINAWTEIVATATPFIVYGVIQGLPYLFNSQELLVPEPLLPHPASYFVTIAVTLVASLATLYLTAPDSEEKLLNFYRQVQPGGWWGPIRAKAGVKEGKSRTFPLVVCWLSAVVMTYSFLFTLGKFIFGENGDGLIWLSVALVSGGVCFFFMKKAGIRG